MYKIYIPNNSKQGIGGGWTFRNNLIKGMPYNKFVGSWQEADIILITGATMTSRDEITSAKKAGKKIVFRIDNMPKDSRNRGTAFSRMFDFARMSDHFIFQSMWALDYVGWWYRDKGIDMNGRWDIIHNGFDPEHFYKKEDKIVKDRYIYVQYNRDENKRQTEAFYTFHKIFRENKKAELFLVGQFSPELVENHFDFFAGEKVTYLGVKEHDELGEIFRSCEYILFPAYLDASPNTLMEAMACGCKPVGLNPEGGSVEVSKILNRTIRSMAEDYNNIFKKVLG